MVVAPASIALSTCSQSAEVVVLYPTSLRDCTRVCAKKSGTVADSFKILLITARPPLGASAAHCGLKLSSAASGSPIDPLVKVVSSGLLASIFVSDFFDAAIGIGHKQVACPY